MGCVAGVQEVVGVPVVDNVVSNVVVALVVVSGGSSGGSVEVVDTVIPLNISHCKQNICFHMVHDICYLNYIKLVWPCI